MRVLIVSQYFWPENFRVNDLSVELVKRGHEVTVLTGLPNYPDGEIFEDFRKAPANFASLQGVEIVRVPPPDPNLVSPAQLVEQLDAFLVSAGAVGRVNDAGREHGQIRAFNNRTFDVAKAVPTVVMRNEDYGRLSAAALFCEGRALARPFVFTSQTIAITATAAISQRTAAA